jgi:hypothetical protein
LALSPSNGCDHALEAVIFIGAVLALRLAFDGAALSPDAHNGGPERF